MDNNYDFFKKSSLHQAIGKVSCPVMCPLLLGSSTVRCIMIIRSSDNNCDIVSCMNP